MSSCKNNFTFLSKKNPLLLFSMMFAHMSENRSFKILTKKIWLHHALIIIINAIICVISNM